MSVNDVDLDTQQTASSVGFSVHPSTAQRRLTIQHFSVQDFLIPFVTPQNCDGRPSDQNDWPPPFIFDVAYGYAALKTWGVSEFIDFARERTKNIYNDKGGGSNGKLDNDMRGDGILNGTQHEYDEWEEKATVVGQTFRSLTIST